MVTWWIVAFLRSVHIHIFFISEINSCDCDSNINSLYQILSCKILLQFFWSLTRIFMRYGNYYYLFLFKRVSHDPIWQCGMKYQFVWSEVELMGIEALSLVCCDIEPLVGDVREHQLNTEHHYFDLKSIHVIHGHLYCKLIRTTCNTVKSRPSSFNQQQ